MNQPINPETKGFEVVDSDTQNKPGSTTSDSADKPDHSKVFEALKDKYSDFKEFGKGGMGSVYEAIETASGKSVVVKVMPSMFQSSFRWMRFRREAAALALLKHPSIVPYLDHGTVWDEQDDPTKPKGWPYLVMDKIPGTDLQTLVEKRSISQALNPPFEDIIEQFSQVADALVFCHSKGLIHRDLKPSNIVIHQDTKQAILIDFGLVKLDNDADSERQGFTQQLTQQGDIVGTPMFMPPEQLFGKVKEMTSAVDVWSFAATLYFAASGKLPYAGHSLSELASLLETRDPKPLKVMVKTVPPWLDQLCRTCLRRDVQHRPSMTEVAKTMRTHSRSYLERMGMLKIVGGFATVILISLAIIYFLRG